MILEVDKLNSGYGPIQVLWDISLKAMEGEIATVIGPNGAGKSTLMKAIMGQLPHTGRIIYKGHTIDHLPPERVVALGVAFVPEGARAFPDMTVIDNLKMGAFIKSARPRREETLQEVFALFPILKERQNQMARTLSGGERQMLAIGRALMSRPDLLLLDEPSLGLSPIVVKSIFNTIWGLRDRGTTILLVEQNVFLSLEMSDRAYVLEQGRVVMEGTGRELLRSEHVKRSYLAV